ncbi:MAG: carbon starvation CstA family protein [Candidatus Eisenbacteria bacterium]
MPATFARWPGPGHTSSHLMVFDHRTWAMLILAYCGWINSRAGGRCCSLMATLGGFVLYSMAAGVIGVLFGGYEVQQPARGWDCARCDRRAFPFLFVTIARGACSGFHGLVCSAPLEAGGARVAHAVGGYGAMLAEGFVALIALAAIMIASSDSISGWRPARSTATASAVDISSSSVRTSSPSP